MHVFNTCILAYIQSIKSIKSLRESQTIAGFTETITLFEKIFEIVFKRTTWIEIFEMKPA